ncbi:hypothetical protein ACWGH8_16525 [Nonomuraea muscovyensis]
MTQHPFPMFATPDEAGTPAVTDGYPAYLLGRRTGARTPSSADDVADRGDTPARGPAADRVSAAPSAATPRG